MRVPFHALLMSTLVIGACTDSAPAGVEAGHLDATSAVIKDAASADAARQDARVALCSLEAPTACPDPVLRYSDIAPVVARRCLSCHAGTPGGSWPLVDYQHVADWQDTIRAAMLDCTMPPVSAEAPMSYDERMQLLLWIRCGALP